ncbi:multisubunit Na+/H+ antiporter, MnhB subunit [Aciduliprofundum sp. MAR08-339]|uniref:Na(+)/H(+) antiporter subunit B n=1 Tax=Aciduliprofundum sp. (strain MAR08-339) TaxID=673860 RepID=UPI0002A4CD8E|nr:multisubunit Na+/H+ antiporter, MnhB subunit [Aciduliprofundum sp. MAR08-339]
MMSKIVRTQANFLYVFIMIFGFYIVAHGHLTPGGGFQGGAVIATGIALIVVSYNYNQIKKWIKKTHLTAAEAIGLLAFIITAFMGIGTSFFYNWLANTGFLFGDRVSYGPNPGYLNTAGTLPIMNLAVGIEVLGGLSVIVIYYLHYLKEVDKNAV